MIDRGGALTSKKTKKKGLLVMKMRRREFSLGRKKFRAKRESCLHNFLIFFRSKRRRECCANDLGKSSRNTISKTRNYITFMDNKRNSQNFSREYHRKSNKSSLGKNNIRTKFEKKKKTLKKSQNYKKRIKEILPRKISSNFS